MEEWRKRAWMIVWVWVVVEMWIRVMGGSFLLAWVSRLLAGLNLVVLFTALRRLRFFSHYPEEENVIWWRLPVCLHRAVVSAHFFFLSCSPHSVTLNNLDFLLDQLDRPGLHDYQPFVLEFLEARENCGCQRCLDALILRPFILLTEKRRLYFPGGLASLCRDDPLFVRLLIRSCRLLWVHLYCAASSQPRRSQDPTMRCLRRELRFFQDLLRTEIARVEGVPDPDCLIRALHIASSPVQGCQPVREFALWAPSATLFGLVETCLDVLETGQSELSGGTTRPLSWKQLNRRTSFLLRVAYILNLLFVPSVQGQQGYKTRILGLSPLLIGCLGGVSCDAVRLVKSSLEDLEQTFFSAPDLLEQVSLAVTAVERNGRRTLEAPAQFRSLLTLPTGHVAESLFHLGGVLVAMLNSCSATTDGQKQMAQFRCLLDGDVARTAGRMLTMRPAKGLDAAVVDESWDGCWSCAVTVLRTTLELSTGLRRRERRGLRLLLWDSGALGGLSGLVRGQMSEDAAAATLLDRLRSLLVTPTKTPALAALLHSSAPPNSHPHKPFPSHHTKVHARKTHSLTITFSPT